jgi:tetratricopeptide (TPR) repeat protein
VADGLAASLLRLGRGEQALAAYDRLLARQPQSPEARRGKARMLVGLGRPAEALPLYERLLARAPEDADLAREHAEALRLSRPHD